MAALLVVASANLGFIGEPALQALRFHIAAALLPFALLLFAVRAWRRGLLFVLVAAAGVAIGANDIHAQQARRAPLLAAQPTPLLKLISFNILDTNMAGGRPIADYVAASGADIVILLEARPVFGELDRLAPLYPYRVGCDSIGECDSLLLSRTPLANVSIRSLGSVWRDRLITATTQVAGQTVNLASVHLVKPYFDYMALDEVEALQRMLRQIKGPLLVAGDFNAPAWSADVLTLANRADLVPGPDYPATWPVPLGPIGIPIDNVFTRGPLVVTDVRAIPDAMGSNHRGLLAEVGLAATPAAPAGP